jgi:hypothetical protein
MAAQSLCHGVGSAVTILLTERSFDAPEHDRRAGDLQ